MGEGEGGMGKDRIYTGVMRVQQGMVPGPPHTSPPSPQALIGYFDLDPNRVLDLVLEAMEHQPGNDAYLKLVPMFERESVVQLLGFKFQQYQVGGEGGGTCSYWAGRGGGTGGGRLLTSLQGRQRGHP